MKDNVTTRSVSLFYPDPEKLVFWLFLHSRDKFAFFYPDFIMLFYPDSDSNRKFSVPWLKADKKAGKIRIKKRVCHVNGEITRKLVFLDPDKKAKLTSW